MKKTIILLLFFLVVLGLIGCDKMTYIINFDSNGGSQVTALEVVRGSLYSLPLSTKEGYVLAGWYTSSEFTSEFTEETKLNSNITLYAKWIEVSEHLISYFDVDPDFSIVTGDFDNYIIGPGNEIHVWEKKFSDMGPLSVTYDISKDFDFTETETVKILAFGYYYKAVLSSSGRVFTWGENKYGELGDGSTYNSDSPKDITDEFGLAVNETIISLAVGYKHTVALSSLGRVFTWGFNSSGQLGDKTLISKSTPIDITESLKLGLDEHVTSIYAISGRCFAITSLGRLLGWGNNETGELGDNTYFVRQAPIDITPFFNLNNGENIIQVVPGFYHTLAVSSEGRIFTWGKNFQGQLGDGTTVRKLTPTDITAKFDFAEGESIADIIIEKGIYASSFLLTSAGRLFTWGYNFHGQLGIDSKINNPEPTDITGSFAISGEEIIIRIEANNMHAFAISSENRIWAWGYNSTGQIGNRTRADALEPIEITDEFGLQEIEMVEDIQTGSLHTVMTTSLGRVFIWGNEQVSELEDKTPVYKTTPSEVGSTFYGINKQIGMDTVYYMESLELLEPTKTGFVFAGWYIDVNRTQPFYFDTMPNEDLKLYAKWIID